MSLRLVAERKETFYIDVKNTGALYFSTNDERWAYVLGFEAGAFGRVGRRSRKRMSREARANLFVSDIPKKEPGKPGTIADFLSLIAALLLRRVPRIELPGGQTIYFNDPALKAAFDKGQRMARRAQLLATKAQVDAELVAWSLSPAPLRPAAKLVVNNVPTASWPKPL